NWNSNALPGVNDAAIIPNVAVQPTLTANITISTLTIQSGSSVTLAGFNLTLSSFTNAGTFVLRGTEQVSSIPNNLTGSTVAYVSSGGNSLVISSWTYRNLWINGTSAYNLTAALNVLENLTISAGTVDTTAGNSYAVTVSSSWINTGGVFNA